jgi:hypothetical protein
MKMEEDRQANKYEELHRRISDLERRMDQMQARSGWPGTGIQADLTDGSTAGGETSGPDESRQISIESRIGEYGMAWLGNIVLLTGILFLSYFLQRNDHLTWSFLLGFSAVAGIYAIAFYTRENMPYLSTLFTFNGHMLLFVQSMRIYVFSGSRIMENAFAGYGIVVAVILVLLCLAYLRKSQVLLIITWIMALITGFASDTSHLLLSILLGISLTSVFFAYRNHFWIGTIISILLVYFSFLLWALGNPFITGTLEIRSSHQFGHIYLFAIALVYSGLALFPKLKSAEENYHTASIVLNGVGFSLAIALSVIAFFTNNYQLYFGLIAVFCLGYSVLLQSQGRWKNIAALYAIYCFVAFSITIAGIYHFPLAFLLLSIESLLVVSMALWFRSRFIVIMNAILYMALLLTYVGLNEFIDSINFAFAGVAFVTARIMNWKKQRLEIRTELIRNLYLVAGFIMLLLGLHKALPPHFVTLAWSLSAVAFFLMSLLIRNIKYRWLAIAAIVVASFHLFIHDLKILGIGLRVVALMLLAFIALGISIYYSQRLKKKKESPRP